MPSLIVHRTDIDTAKTGSAADPAEGIAIDASGQAYVTGYTLSSNFPMVNALQSTQVLTEAFVSKLNITGTSLLYSTYLGGNGIDMGHAIAVDSADQVVIVGETTSANFTTTVPLQATKWGQEDAFITKLNAAGSARLFSTYYGASFTDIAFAVAVRGQASLYFTGQTASTTFPTFRPRQASNAGAHDAFVVRVDEMPQVAFANGTYTTSESISPAPITVTLSSGFGLTVTVRYTSTNGTALAGSDYTSATGILTFTPDVTVLTFTVPITNDLLDELDETVNFVLGNPVSATLGTPITSVLTIVDDDAPPQVRFSSGTYTVTESTSPATLTVTLSAASSLTATVNYTTTNGTALAGSDYTSTAGLLSFPPGVVTQTISIPIINDAANELTETLSVSLTNPANATLGTPFTATLSILDDDVSTGGVISYTYDALYRLTRADYADGRYFAYAYDAVGNILTKTVCSGAGCTPAVTAYVYDDGNRLTSVGGVSQTWDNNGNLRFDGVMTYTYDAANRLITVTQGLTLTTGLVYNGLGDRVNQVVNGVVTTYTLDLAGGLTQVLADGTYTYLYGNGRIAQATVTQTAYFLGDALGSVRQLVGGAGQVTLDRSYEPYGSVLSSAGTGTTNYGFTGEWRDGSGLIYLRARWLGTATGTFLTKDIWRDNRRPLSLNGWSYVEGDPINRVDPSGHWYCQSGLVPWGADCATWVNNALTDLRNAGTVGMRLVEFFYERDNALSFVGQIAMLMCPPLSGYASGVKIYFEPLFTQIANANAFAIAPDQIHINNIIPGYYGQNPSSEAVVTFGHEISHLDQGTFGISVQGEVLATLVGYYLESALNVPHRPDASFIISDKVDPWSDVKLQSYKVRFHSSFPLRIGLGISRNWLDKWGISTAYLNSKYDNGPR